MALAYVPRLGAQEATPVTPPASSKFTLSGRILEKGSKAPVLGGSLYLEPLAYTPTAATTPGTNVSQPPITPVPLSFSAEADTQGNYKVSVPEGVYRMAIAGEGYKKKTVDSLAVHRDLQKDFYMEKDGFTLPEVVVTASKVPPTQVSHETLSKEELISVPGTMGGDVVKALQALPGVVTAGTLNGNLLVRGNGPFDNQYYVDNVPIGFPFHFGIISTVDSNLVDGIDFYSGGFPARFPNSMGGLVDLSQRDPRSDRWGVRSDVNLLLSELEFEGPITSNSSLAVAGRRSYLDVFASNFTGNAGDIQVPVFDDYQVKYSWNPSPKVHWNLVAFGSDDVVSGSISASTTVAQQDPALAGGFNFHEGYNSQGLNFRDTSDDQNTLANTLYHTNSFFDFLLGGSLFENTSVENFGDRLSLIHSFDKDASLEAGLQYDYFIDSLDAYFVVFPTQQQGMFNFSTLQRISANDNFGSGDMAAYLDQKLKAFDQKLELSLGARLDYLTSDSTFILGPRLSAAYHLAGDTTLKASCGYYYEAPNRILGAALLDPSLGNPDLGPDQSIASVAGVEQRLNDSGLLFRVEGYEKDLSNLIESTGDSRNYANIGSGYARGIEFFLRQPPTERFFGWIAYSLSDSQRQDSPVSAIHPYPYDEPSVITAVGNYKINPGWDAGLKVTYSTGLPYTPESPGPATVIGGQGVTLPDYGAPDSARLPDYTRVDFETSIKTVYDTWEWRIYFDIINLFNAKNVLGYQYSADYRTQTPQYDLPFLPYIGFEAKY